MVTTDAAALSAKTLKRRERRTDRAVAWLLGLLVLGLAFGLWSLSAFHLDKAAGPSGGTAVGYVLGGLTVLLYGVVTLYSWRRSRRAQRRAMMRTWMEVHLALGFVAGVTAVLHAGPRLGAPLHGAFLIAWLLLVGTGLVGKVLYVVVPRRLTALEEEALLIEDVVERQRAMRVEVDQLAEGASEAVQRLADEDIPKHIRSPGSYAKRRLKREEVVLEIYDEIGGDAAVPAEDRDVVRRIILCLVEDRFLGAQLRYQRALRAWLPTHIALTTLCLPWLFVHVVTVLLF